METNYVMGYNTIMPQFRRAAAKTMARSYGMKQQEIAKLLGTTQAAVSKYISSDDPQTSISQKDVTSFIEYIRAGDIAGARQVICRLCKASDSLECAMVTEG